MIDPLVISNVVPSLQNGLYPIKRVLGESVTVHADLFGDGHKQLKANLLWRKKHSKKWTSVPMQPLGNDLWKGSFHPDAIGLFEYTVEGWFDPLDTWKDEIIRKIEGGVFKPIDLEPGIELLSGLVKQKKELEEPLAKLRSTELPDELLPIIRALEIPRDPDQFDPPLKKYRHRAVYEVNVKRKRAAFSSWYEIFPRSCSPIEGRHGTFKDVINLIPSLADKGFDILYFPPIHPIGRVNRKGKNNARQAKAGDPGSPWAIGSAEGGHKSIHPWLGTLEDFRQVVQTAKEHGMEIALDIAFQCAPDHPYLKEHPEWFKWRSDGTIQFAENPPKKYEDIVPFDFNSPAAKELWEELKSIIAYWLEQGVKVFRVDNPHTKPFDMWAWLIAEINRLDPDVIFLSEAFTRPKVMQQLSLVGFDQTYTYFSWRNSKQELTQYMHELNEEPLKEHFRPNFWPNTPDILPEYLQHGGRSAFISRLVLASTLSSNYGIYGPVYEYCIGAAVKEREEYLDSEKYELKNLSHYKGENLTPLIKTLNTIRNSYTALQTTWNTYFCETENNELIAYVKFSQKNDPHLLIVVNIDFCHAQEGMVTIPMERLNLRYDTSYTVHDLLSGEKYVWWGPRNYIKLDPGKFPAHLFAINPQLEQDRRPAADASARSITKSDRIHPHGNT